ncbi:hypothetical protein DYU11_15720 [Fibrisoma montanum]|uniref:ZU5 domain-containing protein n=1 Tax=Fibrisoma montanum TaxID=2305895 RepID=A0A418M8Q3_9BACT|nr:hypothetical protein [Fibrisoma montanum]RIV22463.1 hypothetical protein DYU11_15720 [Fibrisoma montanum]
MFKCCYYLLAAWLCLGCLNACKPDQTEVDPSKPTTEQPLPAGDVTEIGQPDGTAVSKIIGPEGGTLTTADGRVQLTLPAGAVSQATTISILPITNHTPNGVGQSYRFSPDGLQFSKPATLTFQYTDADVVGSAPAGLGIAYQRSSRIWYAVPGKQIDTQKRQVTVPMHHFSDWSLFEEFYLVAEGADKGFLNYGESTTLTFIQIASLTGKGEEPLMTKTTGGQANDGLKWSLIGDGQLTPDKHSAIYTAPRSAPKQNPVTISVEVTFVNSPAKLILTREVYIGPGYIKLNFLGQERLYTLGVYLDDEEPEYSAIVGGNTSELFSIDFSNARAGSILRFSDDREPGKCRITFEFANGGKQYDGGHDNCDGEDMIANGQVVFEEYEPGKFVKGTISGNLIDADDNCTRSGPAISGEFYVRTLRQ